MLKIVIGHVDVPNRGKELVIKIERLRQILCEWDLERRKVQD